MVMYFAYGSNMDKDHLDKWCENRRYPLVNFTDIAPARLNGYKIVFNYFSPSRNSGAANIMKSCNDSTYGLLFELSGKDLETIRIKEGFPKYYGEIQVTVGTFNNETIDDVVIYKVVKQREKLKHQPPKFSYLELITKNAKKYGFPSEYIHYLESIETVD